MTIGLEHLSCDKRLRELGLLYKSPYLSQNNKVLITHQTEQEQNRTQPGSVSNIFMLEARNIKQNSLSNLHPPSFALSISLFL